MKKILVLGAGRVGSLIIDELSIHYDVTVLDCNPLALNKYQKTNKVILGRLIDNVKELSNFDLVIGAVPGAFGLETAELVLENGKDYVDISFAPEDLRQLDALAIENNARCLIDFGVAPGLSNLVFGYLYSSFKKLYNFTIKVGGLPRKVNPPWYYEAPFSPSDVIEEYTRPARHTFGGILLTEEPLTHLEPINNVDFLKTSPLVAFLTDGARTLLDYKDVNIIEKTIRHEKHFELIKALKDSGFFNQETGARALTEKLLIDQWKQTSHNDYTLMYLDYSGQNHLNEHVIGQLRLLDQAEENYSSMARTTGYTCIAGAKLLLNNLWTEPGVHAPEIIGQNKKCFDFVIDYLDIFNIRFTS